MIALLDSLPLLRLENDQLTRLRRDWFCFCLRRAAEKAGYTHWWLAEHVTESVLCYFATSYDKGIVSLADTREIVRSVLQAIGYGEVSIHYEALNPPFELSLAEIAREAGAGFELGFFQLLRERLQPALSDRASNVHISGLQNCVRLLQSAKTWSRSCSQLRNEIVDFLRAQMIQAEVKSDVLLTIR